MVVKAFIKLSNGDVFTKAYPSWDAMVEDIKNMTDLVEFRAVRVKPSYIRQGRHLQ